MNGIYCVEGTMDGAWPLAVGDHVLLKDQPLSPKRRRRWAARFRSSQGSFADAYVVIGPVSFHLTNGPGEGWAYRIATRRFDLEARW